MTKLKLAEFVGKTICEKRQQKKLSQEKLAELLGTSQDIVSKMEQGNFSIKFDRLEKLANLFNCNVADLFKIPNESRDADAEYLADMLNNLSTEDRKLVKGTVAEMVRLIKSKK